MNSGNAVMCTSLTVNSTRRPEQVGLTTIAASATGTFTCHVGRDLVGLLRCVVDTSSLCSCGLRLFFWIFVAPSLRELQVLLLLLPLAVSSCPLTSHSTLSQLPLDL